MLRFFRHIRQKLFLEGRVSKYFGYALGEIALIVVGILIALQLNNWNEEHSRKRLEHLYLTRLLEDFGENNQVADRTISYSEYQQKNASLLLESLHGDVLRNEAIQWCQSLTHLWMLNHLSYVQTTWSELNATGNLGILSNNELVRRLTRFHAALGGIERVESEWAAINLNYRSQVNSILPHRLRKKVFETLDLYGENIGSMDGVPEIDPYLNALRLTPGINGILSDIQMNRQTSVEVHKNFKREIEAMREYLSGELE